MYRLFKSGILIFCILFSYSCHSQTVYVSSDGNDSNDGRTKTSPVKTIKCAQSIGDTILLRRGNTFYENVVIRKGVLGNYGEGKKPVLSGYKRIVNPQWEEVGNNIWRICLTDDDYSGFDTAGSSKLNNIGCIHEFDMDSIHGRRMQFKSQLKKDWDFWQTEKHSHKDIRDDDFDTLYLYLKKNPNELKIEFSVAEIAVRVSNATIDGVRLEGFGFGVSAGTHSEIRNCEIDAIGGMMVINDNYFASYGNGIEFWVSKNTEDCLVENCVISRCYDCGVTIQGDGGGQATPRNIIVRNNLLEQCCQGWEDFLRNDSNVVYENCVFEDNLVLNSGNNTGFGYPPERFKYCHVLGNNTEGDKGMIIRNNVFVGGNYYCSGDYHGAYMSNNWQNNTCIIKRGDFLLGNYYGTRDVIRVPKERGDFTSLAIATEEAIRQYRVLTGDTTTKFIILKEGVIKRQTKKFKREYYKKNGSQPCKNHKK